MVLAGFLLMATGWGIVYNTSSLFIVPISEELGLLRSQITFTMTLRSLVQMMVALFAGRIYRRFSLLKSMKFMSLVLVISYILFGFATNIWQIYLLTIIGSLANSFIGIIPISMLIGNWFQEKRGFALGLAFMGTGIGGMLYNSLTGRWILNYGWQRSYQLQALVMFMIIVPTVFFLVKEKPQDMGLEAYGRKGPQEPSRGISLEEAKGLPYFWIIALVSCVANFTLSMAMITLAPHLVDIGYGFAFSANILALTMASLAVGKLVLGELLDRLGLKGAISISIMGSVFAYIGLFNAQHKLLLILVILGTGIGCAYGTMVDPYLTRSIFGEKDYSSIYGILAAAASLGGMLSPIVSGLSYDINGNYQNLLFQMGLLALALLLAAQWIFSHKNMQAVKEKWDLD